MSCRTKLTELWVDSGYKPIRSSDSAVDRMMERRCTVFVLAANHPVCLLNILRSNRR